MVAFPPSPSAARKRVSCCCNEMWIEVFRQPNGLYTHYSLHNDSGFIFSLFFLPFPKKKAQQSMAHSPFVQFFFRGQQNENIVLQQDNGSWSGHFCVDTFILNVSRFSLASLWNFISSFSLLSTKIHPLHPVLVFLEQATAFNK